MESSQGSTKLSDANAASMEVADAPPAEMEKFTPSKRFKLAFTSLAIVNLACALDATSISNALPVSLPFPVEL